MNKLNRKNEILQHNDAGDGDIVGNKEGSSVPVNAAKGIDTIICTPSDNAKGAIFTIGKFSAFLSCCAVGLIPCKSQELDAFIVVSQIEISYKTSFHPFKLESNRIVF